MTERWLQQLFDKMDEHSGIERAVDVGGSRDYIAGQRDMLYVDLDVHVTPEFQEKVKDELDESEEPVPESPALRALRHHLELELGLSVGDDWVTAEEHVDDGVIQTTAQRDMRPAEFGGSDVTRRFPKPSRRY